jgi:hypothetical protein
MYCLIYKQLSDCTDLLYLTIGFGDKLSYELRSIKSLIEDARGSPVDHALAARGCIRLPLTLPLGTIWLAASWRLFYRLC